VFGVDAENQNPALLVGMQNGAAAMENSLAGPQKVKHRITICLSNSTSAERRK
jgi:hypothetical protein